eukprot:TRINITY_DN5725_c0_g6_i1.p1 TRINITY_DN5725_c0_g6~~TRINITY_DN5725_c0_g6_i1.p1  ORF type:complete len:251 (-),score=49.72 TRINITY_DN5725_c0_g6_i1:332-1084(-)
MEEREQRDEAFINDWIMGIWNNDRFNRQPTPVNEVISPSGKYKLEINSFADPQYWAYTQGKIYGQERNLIAEVRRNYGGFKHTWLEGHKDGNDYLLCAADYQGQTMIRLNTGEVKHFVPLSAKYGWGFIWASVYPSNDKSLLAVVGCIWAGPYETKIFDVREPMSLPLPLLFKSEIDNFDGWTEHEIPECKITGDLEVCDKQGSRLKGLTWNEISALEVEDEETADSSDASWWKTERRTIKWRLGDGVVN